MCSSFKQASWNPEQQDLTSRQQNIWVNPKKSITQQRICHVFTAANLWIVLKGNPKIKTGIQPKKKQRRNLTFCKTSDNYIPNIQLSYRHNIRLMDNFLNALPWERSSEVWGIIFSSLWPEGTEMYLVTAALLAKLYWLYFIFQTNSSESECDV